METGENEFHSGNCQGHPATLLVHPTIFKKPKKCPCTFFFYKKLFFLFHASFLLSLLCFLHFGVFSPFQCLCCAIFVGAGCACALLWCDICQLRYVAAFLWLIVYFWQQNGVSVSDSTQEIFFQRRHYNCGRKKLLPWSLAEDVFREIQRKKVSSVVEITPAEECFFRGVSRKTSSVRLHGRSILLLLTLQLRKTASSVETHGRHFPRALMEDVFRSCDINSGRKLLSWSNSFYDFLVLRLF